VTLKIVGLHLEISRDCRNMEINFIGRRSDYVFFLGCLNFSDVTRQPPPATFI